MKERVESVSEFYRKHKAQIEHRKKNLRFESEGERKDYERAISSNPENIYGLPPFFPAEKITVSFAIHKQNEENNNNNIYPSDCVDVELYCDSCQKLTIFSITPTQSFCKKCGNKYNYKLIYLMYN